MRIFILTVLFFVGAFVRSAWAEPDTFGTYRWHPDRPLMGKMAKFIVSGRLKLVENTAGTPSQLCDYKRFDFAEADRLDSIALQYQQEGDIERHAAWVSGLTDETPHQPDNVSGWCEVLYLDAANWGMLRLEKVSQGDLDLSRMLAAVEGNDCNWDDTKKEEVTIYPDINEITQEIAGVARANLLIMRNDIEALLKVRDEGYTFGSTNLAENCPVIAEFAKGLKP